MVLPSLTRKMRERYPPSIVAPCPSLETESVRPPVTRIGVPASASRRPGESQTCTVEPGALASSTARRSAADVTLETPGESGEGGSPGGNGGFGDGGGGDGGDGGDGGTGGGGDGLGGGAP